MVASVVGALALPVAAYFVVGDQSTTEVANNPDYMWRPPSWSQAGVAAAGSVCVGVVVVAVAVLVRERRRQRLADATVATVLLVAFAGLAVGGGYRVLTAGVIGANIGGGLVLLFGTPLVVALLGVAAFVSIAARRGRGPAER